jgi:hypothetical protein
MKQISIESLRVGVGVHVGVKKKKKRKKERLSIDPFWTEVFGVGPSRPLDGPLPFSCCFLLDELRHVTHEPDELLGARLEPRRRRTRPAVSPCAIIALNSGSVGAISPDE